MIKRDGNAEPVARAQPRANADRRAIVEDVAVRECDGFRPLRCAAGELDIDGVARVGGDIVKDRQMDRRYIGKTKHNPGSRLGQLATRSDARRVGSEGVRPSDSRWTQDIKNNNKKTSSDR